MRYFMGFPSRTLDLYKMHLPRSGAFCINVRYVQRDDYLLCCRTDDVRCGRSTRAVGCWQGRQTGAAYLTGSVRLRTTDLREKRNLLLLLPSRSCKWIPTPAARTHPVTLAHPSRLFPIPARTLSISCMYTVSEKVTTLAWYNFDKRQPILIIFGRNVAKKISS